MVEGFGEKCGFFITSINILLVEGDWLFLEVMGSTPINLLFMIDYNFLKQVQRNERNSQLLSRLNETFYEDCSHYFYLLEHGDVDELDVRLYRNAFNCYTEIVERRLEKISRKVYYNVFGNYRLMENPDSSLLYDGLPVNILGCEMVFFNSLVDVYTRFFSCRFSEYEGI